MPVFTPPFIHIRDKSSMAFHFPGTDIGITVLKEGTSYRQVSNPTHEEVTAATIAYLGGRSYTVDTAEAAALTAAGYGANIK